ncbi:MAG: hypothetical protein A4E62_00730 [Syntrophorhabdus sp. PtaU1.Bin002]|nr:MAG: hypothetical protein A4E62_00730 [Syntrophorhabdus sp. PtaU1.Bin002]
MNADSRLVSMTFDQVRAAAPSVFADHPWEGVSQRYAFIPTASVVESLIAEGWNITAARQQRVLLQDRKEFTRHMLRFRRDDALTLAVGDVFPEIVLTNSHDRGSAYRMDAGLFRLVCTNGLVVDDATFARLSVRHTGNVLDDVRKGADEIAKELPRIMGEVRDMQTIELAPDERGIFAKAAMSLKFDESLPVEPFQVLTGRRYGDQKSDLWTTFNVIQENLTKGGLRYTLPAHTTEDGIRVPPRRTRTREVKSIREDTKLNKALWMLAEEMKRLKMA